jgi:4-hydroxy-2-oxoheptanedioate aldolase
MNPIIDRLARRLPVLAMGVRSSRTGDIARIAKATGHDMIWVDLEHSAMPLDAAAQICACAVDIGIASFVRIPEREYGAIGRVLDGGATGIIAPRIETLAQAQDVIAACRFPPLGHRSAIASLPQFGYRRMDAGELFGTMNQLVAIQILIESPLGITNIADIAALPGVDMIAIGTNDLSAELGVPGDFKHPLVRSAHEDAIAACKLAGKPLAIGGIGDAAYCAELILLGAAPFLMTGTDTDLLLSAANVQAARALGALKGVLTWQ